MTPPPITLPEILQAVEAGRYPPADGTVTVVRQASARHAAVLAFTAHNVVAADLDPGWVREQLPPGDLAAPLNPPFLSALAAALDRRVNAVDMAVLADPLPGPPEIPLTEVTDRDHPRVVRALRYREDVRVWTVDGGTGSATDSGTGGATGSATGSDTGGGMVLLGRGLGGRWETAVEVEPSYRGNGLGRTLARAARHLVPEGRPLWAQVSPGNAASVRAFLAAGFVPVGSEALLVPVS